MARESPAPPHHSLREEAPISLSQHMAGEALASLSRMAEEAPVSHSHTASKEEGTASLSHMVEEAPVSPSNMESRGEATANHSHTAVSGVHLSTCQVDS